MKKYLEVFNSNEIFRTVCIGDSTTSQEWCHPNWIDWLNFTFHEDEDYTKDWKRKFINSGRDGADIQHFLDNFETEVSFYKPRLVIASIGLNHIYLKSAPDKVENLLEKLFSKIKSTNADLVTWSPYVIPEEKHLPALEKINEIYERVTKKYDGIYLDLFTEFKKYDLKKLFTFISDGNDDWDIKKGDIDFLHCNPIGCQIIAERISKEVFDKPLSDWKFGTMKLVNLEEYKK